jgi:hypothetical protein
MNHKEGKTFWNCLHDGKITLVTGALPTIQINVQISYLRSMFPGAGDSFVVSLVGCSRLDFVEDKSQPKTSSVAEISSKKLTILEALQEESCITLACLGRKYVELKLEYGGLIISTDSGDTITVEELARASEEHWNRWERIGELTNVLFDICPVWIVESRIVPDDSEDFDDEFIDWQLNGRKIQEYVRPRESVGTLIDDQMVYIVKSRFILADGTEHFGFSSPCDGHGLDYSQPVLITPQGHIRFWNDNPPKAPEPEESCRKLQKDVNQIFPVHCEALLPCDGEYLEWTIKEIYVGQ